MDDNLFIEIIIRLTICSSTHMDKNKKSHKDLSLVHFRLSSLINCTLVIHFVA